MRQSGISWAKSAPISRPYSLSWVIWRNAKVDISCDVSTATLVGGFIYHGPTSPGDGSAPAFSVSLDHNAPTHSWGIHT